MSINNGDIFILDLKFEAPEADRLYIYNGAKCSNSEKHTSIKV